MKPTEKDRVQDAVVSLLRRIYHDKPGAEGFLEDVLQLADAVGSFSQRALAQRLDRSVPTIRRLVKAGAIRVAGGKVPAWDAAIAEVALGDVPAGGRHLASDIAAFADWLNERQEARFRSGLDQYLHGQGTPLLHGRSDRELDELANTFLDEADRTAASHGRTTPARRKRSAAKPIKGVRRSTKPGRVATGTKARQKNLIKAGQSTD